MIKKLLQRNTFLRRICILLRNKLNIGSNTCVLENIQNSGNTVTLRGKDNTLFAAPESILRECRVQVDGSGNQISLDADTSLYGDDGTSVYICGNNNQIIIGNHVSLRSVSFFIRGSNNRIVIGDNCSAIYAQFHIEQDGNEICIGAGTTMHGRGHQVIHMAADEGSRILIQEDCMFAHSTQIRSTDSHSIVDLNGKRLNPAKDIIIGPHCWVGLQCILLKGTNVPGHCVVAAGSVCSKTYAEPNCIIAGNPAKVVKQNIDWDRKFV